jgi:hypothetical protein
VLDAVSLAVIVQLGVQDADLVVEGVIDGLAVSDGVPVFDALMLPVRLTDIE